ncbi:MAG: aquaporin [Mycobacteriales bacterium]
MLLRRAFAELLGSALLATAVVGSGIAAAELSTDTGLQLLENSVATGAALIALILALGPVSAAFNPVVTLVELGFRAVSARDAGVFVAAQFLGTAGGVVVANLMYDLPAVTLSQHSRSGSGVLLAEVVATLGLVVVVFGVVRSRPSAVAYAVGGYIAAAYWFTSSTSFANPAITVARSLTDTFAGIDPSSVAAFAGMQVVGGLLGFGAVRLLYPDARRIAGEIAA